MVTMGILTSLFAARNQAAVEKRAHPSADIDWATYLDIGARTGGLQPVSVEGAQALPAVYACINVLSETLASLPLIVYSRKGDGSRERALRHPLYRLLHYKPNAEQTAFEFLELMTSYVAGWGNGRAEIEFSNGGKVLGLWPLRPDRTWPRRNPQTKELEFITYDANGGERTLPAWRVLNIRARGGDGVNGYSPIRVAMMAVSLGLATEEFGARFFSNGANPGMVVEHPGKLSDAAYQRLKTSWQDNAAGLENAHRVRILEEGMKIDKIGIPPEEAQFLETRVFQAQEIARIYRMPPHKIGLLQQSTFSNIEHQSIEFVTDTMRPWLVRVEQAMWRDLLTPSDQEAIYMEFLIDSLLRGDTPSRNAAYAVGRQWGWLSVNEIRERENMERIKDGDGYLQPLNMQPIGTPPQSGVQRSWLIPIVEDAARRITRREAQDLRSQAVKVLRSGGQDGLQRWTREHYDEFGAAAAQMLAPLGATVARAAGAGEATLASALRGVVADTAAESVRRITLITSEAQGQGVSPDDALEQYAATIDAAGADALAQRIMVVLMEVL